MRARERERERERGPERGPEPVMIEGRGESHGRSKESLASERWRRRVVWGDERRGQERTLHALA